MECVEKFVEFHRWDNEPISLKLEDITAFYPNPGKRTDGRKSPTTIIALGSNSYEVEEDYKTVSKIIRGEKEYHIEYSEEDKELIDKWIETLKNTVPTITPTNKWGVSGPTQF